MLKATAERAPLHRDVTGAAIALLIKYKGFMEEIIANGTVQDKRKLFCSTEPFHEFFLYRLHELKASMHAK